MTNTDRTKILVHLRRIPNLLGNAFRHGPDGSLDGEFATEHPVFVHQSCGFYLLGCLAYLVDEAGEYSWNKPGLNFADFDLFCDSFPADRSWKERGIAKDRMCALAEIRNAAAHNGYDASRNRNRNSVTIIAAANIPGVEIESNGITSLREEFLEYVRLSCLAVRQYHGDD